MADKAHSPNSFTKAALDQQIEEHRKVYADAIASLNAFADAVRNLPYPPWNTTRRQREQQRRKQAA